MTEQASSTITIDASPAAVMAAIADFAAYPTWTPQVKRVEILDADEQGRGTSVRFEIDAKVFRDEYTLVYDWSVPDQVSWHLVEGTMQKSQAGSYVLRPIGAGTEVLYELTVDLAIPMLGMFKRKAEKMIIDAALNGLKRHVEGQ